MINTGKHVKQTPRDAQEWMFALARGSYQRAIATGRARWSGADLRGKAARRWGAHYKHSRRTLLHRALRAGVAVRVGTAPMLRGTARRLVLIFGE